jgi:hypothetical protein
MRRLILRVRDKSKISRLSAFCEITYTSKFINVVGVEIKDELIEILKQDPNVVSYRESREGDYQPCLSFC